MNNWQYNPTFPNFLYIKVNDMYEYVNAILKLKEEHHITGNYYGEIMDIDIIPFKTSSDWYSFFFDENEIVNTDNLVNNLKVKPLETEFPVILNFSCNHTYLTWIPMKSVL